MTKVTTPYLLSILSLTLFMFTLPSVLNAVCPTEQQISDLHTKHHNEPHHTLKLGDLVDFMIDGQKVSFKVTDHREWNASISQQNQGKVVIEALHPIPGQEETCSFSIHKPHKTILITLEQNK